MGMTNPMSTTGYQNRGPGLDFGRQVRRDSVGLDSVELVLEIERRFQIEIPDRELYKMTTVGEMHRWLHRALDTTVWSEEAIWNELREIVYRHFDISPEEVRPETSFVDDLGAG